MSALTPPGTAQLIGRELFARAAQIGKSNTILLSFSRGKDSICAAVALMEAGYDLIPFYGVSCPGLSFVEESLDYYERHLFKRHIVRVWHPSFAAKLRDGYMQPPHRLPICVAADIAAYTWADVQQAVGMKFKLPVETLTAVGVRAADSVQRLINIKTNGPFVESKRVFFPIWDWKKDRLIECLSKNSIKLPYDYVMFGRTFDGMIGQFLSPIKKHLPWDYQVILDWFPMADAEVFRYERYHGVQA